MRLPLIGGAYQARSIIANAQRCVNYFPELNRQDSPVPFTYYQRPGRKYIVQDPTIAPAPMRGHWRASNGAGYCVIGNRVYFITPRWRLQFLGAIEAGHTTPTSATDNGIDIMLVDGSTQAYKINLGTNQFVVVDDPEGVFTGANKVDFIDSFILWNFLGSNKFGSTLSNEIVFDPLYIASKITWPDKIQTILVNRREIILFGELKSEIWYDAGNPQFPFSILPGSYIEHGTCAPFSIGANDTQVYWLHQNLNGIGMVLSLKGYDVKRVSNHAIENTIATMLSEGLDITDAIGYCYQQGGHSFYVLTFPSADQTWVYDASLESDPNSAWHQLAWTDENGELHRDRGRCGAFIYGKNVIGDWETGALLELSQTYYADDTTEVVNGAVVVTPGPISFIKGFPHARGVRDPASGQMVDADNKTITHLAFVADIECGNAPLDAEGRPAQISLKWSDDRGKSWGNAVMQSNGEEGEWLATPQWRRMGVARDRVYELSHSIAAPAALNGAWIDVQVNEK